MARGSRRRLRAVALLGLPLVVAGEWVPVERQKASDEPAAFSRSGIGGLSEPGSLGRRLLETTVSRNHVLVASVGVGSPPQQLRCLLDTGSSDLWVPSRHCSHCGSSGSFDAARSSTFKPAVVQTPEGLKPRLVKMTYGTGKIVGVAARDDLAIGSVRVTNQSFILVEAAALPEHRSWDGICGLGWSDLAASGAPLYRRLQEEGRPAIFSLVPSLLGEGPRLVLGEWPTAWMKPGTLAWARAETLEEEGGHAAAPPRGLGAHRSFWVTSGGVAVAGGAPRQVRFIVDSGTNQVLLVPPRHFEQFLRSLLPSKTLEDKCGVDMAAGGLFICDCSVRELPLPPTQVVLGGRAFVVPLAEMFRRVAATDGGLDLCLLQVQPSHFSSQAPPASLQDLLRGLFKPELLGHGCCSWDKLRCGSTAPYCRSSREHCEDHCKGEWIFMDALPFQMPPGGKEVEEVVSGSPDGGVCRTWKVTDSDNRVIKEETLCGPPGDGPLPAPAQRRLRSVPGPASRGAAGASPAERHPMADDLWVLGGVFLELFVTVFDFDSGRMGFAEPIGPSTSIAMAETGLSAVGSLGGADPQLLGVRGLLVLTIAAVALATSLWTLRASSRLFPLWHRSLPEEPAE